MYAVKAHFGTPFARWWFKQLEMSVDVTIRDKTNVFLSLNRCSFSSAVSMRGVKIVFAVCVISLMANESEGLHFQRDLVTPPPPPIRPKPAHSFSLKEK